MTSLTDVVYIITTIFIITLVIVVLASKRSRRTYYFSFGLLSLLGWVVSLYLLYDSSIGYLTLLGRLNFVFGILLLPFVNLFVLNFESTQRSKWEKIIILETIILSVLTIATRLIVQEENLENGNLITSYGVGYFLFIVHFLFYAILLTFNLRKISKSESKEKTPFKILFWGTAISISFGIITSIIVPMIFTYTKFIPVEMYTSIQNSSIITAYLYGIPLAYVLLKYKFLDSRILLGEVIYNAASLLFIILYTIGSFYIVSKLYLTHRGSSYSLGLALMGIFVFVYSRIQKLLARSLKDRIVNPYYKIEEIYEELKNSLDSVLSIDALQELLKRVVFEKMAIIDYTILIKKELGWIIESHGRHKSLGMDIEKLANSFEEFANGKMEYKSIFLDMLKAEPSIYLDVEGIIKEMEETQIEGLVPIFNKGEIFGILLLGHKKFSLRYDSRDISLFQDITVSLGWSLQRMFLYEELENFNKILQSKVDSQTKELRVKIQELQEARQKETDMIDIMGHELRTPATIVKLNAQLLERFTGDIQSDPEAYKRYVDRIKMAVENEIKLINTLLSSAKLEGDKIVIDPEEIDIKNEIEMAIHGNERDAQEKDLPIIDNTGIDIPHVYADKTRVVEILNNLISNAIKYTERGSITIENRFNNDFVEISVIDTGNGIGAEDLPKLGQKFYRARNYIDSNVNVGEKLEIVRPGGTGLGLFVTFNLVRKMGGDIHVESEVGKGSKFIFTLPIYKAQSLHDHNAESQNMFEKLGLKRQ